MYSAEEIEDNDLTDVVPKRVKKSRVKLTVNCIKTGGTGGTDADWIRGGTPDADQMRKLIAMVVSAAVEVTFSSHVYIIGDKIFLQKSGAPIGLELSCAIHRPFMMRFDRLFLIKVQAAGLNMLLYERYVDDTNEVCELRNEDNSDEDLARELQEIANSVIPGLKFEVDLPSRHTDGCLPILDMAVWLDSDGNL